jgi:hypothetical protein
MAFANQPVEEPEKSLRDYASPRCEDIRVQESDSKLEATKYEIKSKIIKMVAANPFAGMVTENPYRHMSDGEIWITHRGVNPCGLFVRRGGGV